ncbi:LysR family transcriptional regulator [Actinobacillus vicugnae]|uniref:LysR family transcriptional regulator n=1 Tax=Actinobacillus vicugnae TaxID=2573093 RepID=UPI001241E0D1|nr:LysR family transcriptional regulator [Actinobacillus vicugnae]
MNNLDWNDLHYFILLVEKQTLTAAANALNVEHSTVSRRIERLEKQLNLHLFDRINKRYLLTDEGSQIYDEAKKLQLNILSLTQSAKDTSEQMAEVVLSAPPFVAHSVLAPQLSEFYRHFSHIRLILHSDTGISNLHQRQADIALRIAQPTQNDLVAKRLRDMEYRWFAHRDYLTRTPESQWQYLSLNLTGSHQQWLNEQLNGKSIRFACNDFQLLKSAVVQQLGIGLLPTYFANKNPEFVQIESINGYQSPLYLVMHEDVRHTQKVRAVADWLIEVFE